MNVTVTVNTDHEEHELEKNGVSSLDEMMKGLRETYHDATSFVLVFCA